MQSRLTNFIGQVMFSNQLTFEFGHQYQSQAYIPEFYPEARPIYNFILKRIDGKGGANASRGKKI